MTTGIQTRLEGATLDTSCAVMAYITPRHSEACSCATEELKIEVATPQLLPERVALIATSAMLMGPLEALFVTSTLTLNAEGVVSTDDSCLNDVLLLPGQRVQASNRMPKQSDVTAGQTLPEEYTSNMVQLELAVDVDMVTVDSMPVNKTCWSISDIELFVNTIGDGAGLILNVDGVSDEDSVTDSEAVTLTDAVQDMVTDTEATADGVTVAVIVNVLERDDVTVVVNVDVLLVESVRVAVPVLVPVTVTDRLDPTDELNDTDSVPEGDKDGVTLVVGDGEG